MKLNPYSRLYLLSLILLSWPLSAAWHYQIQYQGLLSGGQNLKIADAVLERQALHLDQNYTLLQLRISSKAYAQVEKNYPLRLLIQEIYRPDGSILLMKKQSQKKDKRKDELIWYGDGKRALRLRPQGKRAYALPAPIQNWLQQTYFYYKQSHGLEADVQGRLAIFFADLQWRAGYEKKFKLSNGKKIKTYRLKLIQWQEGAVWLAHLYLPKKEQPALVWIDARDHLPLRIEFKHWLGNFVLERQ